MIKPQQSKNDFLKKTPLNKIVKYVISIIVSIMFISILMFVFFTDQFFNTFLKERFAIAFSKTFPEYSINLDYMHYNIWSNRLGCDLITLRALDSSFTCNVDSFSISKIGWIDMLLQRGYTPFALTSVKIEARKIKIDFHKSQTELSFEMLYISAADSQFTIDSIKYSPLIEDEKFFAKSKFRKTRFRFDIPKIKINGLDFMALLQKNTYSAGSINVQDAFADILVNMDKPSSKNLSNPQMPNEALSSMKEIVKIDSFKIIGGRLKYSERYGVKELPGIITFSEINVSTGMISNHEVHPDTTVVYGEGVFMNSARMKLYMEIPLSSKEFSLRYSGSLSEMDVSELNSFIEAGEHHRIKSGILNSATYNIKVDSGRASGTLKAEYKDLSIAVLNNNTGSENGIVDQISSFIGKAFIIRGSNLPDEKGLMKIGEINYTRNPKNSFIQFIWFALRSGLGNIVGL